MAYDLDLLSAGTGVLCRDQRISDRAAKCLRISFSYLQPPSPDKPATVVLSRGVGGTEGCAEANTSATVKELNPFDLKTGHR